MLSNFRILQTTISWIQRDCKFLNSVNCCGYNRHLITFHTQWFFGKQQVFIELQLYIGQSTGAEKVNET